MLFADQPDQWPTSETHSADLARATRSLDREPEELQLGRYRVGDAVTYRATDGREHFAIISQLHMDAYAPGETPEVTIKFVDGAQDRRVQTRRLVPRQRSAAAAGVYGRDEHTMLALATRDLEIEERRSRSEQELQSVRLQSPSVGRGSPFDG